MFLLDTCTLLWLVAEQKELSETARSAIERYSGSIFVSAISGFEIGVKARRGDLRLPMSVRRWFAEALEYHGLLEQPINSNIAVCATELPLIHKDPFDRLIIATAVEEKMRILTPDPKIAAYPGVETIW